MKFVLALVLMGMLAWSCGSSKTCPTYADAGQNQEKATQAN
jgi:hypothetical protein